MGARLAPPDCRMKHGLPLNPLRVHINRIPDGWHVTYRQGQESWGVTATEEALIEALRALRHFVRMTVEERDGKFVEVIR